jgi:hypothetical protein
MRRRAADDNPFEVKALTKEEAVAKAESRWYEGKTPQEIMDF